jgi:hypothetical protein
MAARHADDAPIASVSALAHRYDDRSMRLERELSAIREIEPWSLRFTGGVVPQDPAPDWYGIAELNFNLGGVVRPHLEHQYLAARLDELETTNYEMGSRLRQFRDQVRAAEEQARHDLEITEREISVVGMARRAIETSDAPNVAHARDVLEVEQLSLETDQVYSRVLIEALARLAAGEQQ